MHPELMHLATQARYEDFRREAAAQRADVTRDARGWWRRRGRRAVPPTTSAPAPAGLTPPPAVPAQVKREVPALAEQEQRRR